MKGVKRVEKGKEGEADSPRHLKWTKWVDRCSDAYLGGERRASGLGSSAPCASDCCWEEGGGWFFCWSEDLSCIAEAWKAGGARAGRQRDTETETELISQGLFDSKADPLRPRVVGGMEEKQRKARTKCWILDKNLRQTGNLLTWCGGKSINQENTSLLGMFPSFVRLMDKQHDFKICKLREIISIYSMRMLWGSNKKWKWLKNVTYLYIIARALD